MKKIAGVAKIFALEKKSTWIVGLAALSLAFVAYDNQPDMSAQQPKAAGMTMEAPAILPPAFIEQAAAAKQNAFVITNQLSRPLALSLIKAKKRGVTIAVIFNGRRSVEANNAVSLLYRAGVAVFLSADKSANPIIITDTRTSVSVTAGNVSKTNDSMAAAEAVKRWNALKSNATPY